MTWEARMYTRTHDVHDLMEDVHDLMHEIVHILMGDVHVSWRTYTILRRMVGPLSRTVPIIDS